MYKTRATTTFVLPGILFSVTLLLGACAATQTEEGAATPADSEATQTARTEGTSRDNDRASETSGTSEPEPEIRESAPERYVVREGDTLWDIAAMFLRDPWYWPEIWLVNPEIENPHLIYPGDVLSIYYVDGEPRITVDGGPRVRPTKRLSPEVRVVDREEDVTPISTLQSFMFRPQVLDDETLDNAPYILASQDERVIFGPGDRVYVRNAEDTQQYDLYHIVRRDGELVDPDTGENLGIATLPIGEAEIVEPGNVARANIRKGEREAIRGDRLVPFADEQDMLFEIGRPPEDMEGTIISLFDAISQIGQLQAAIINRGERDGIENGQVMTAYTAGRQVRDPVSDRPNEVVTLPEESVGTVMVFQTFEKVSYILVTESDRTLREGDKVRHPSR
ncbi:MULTISPECIES: LysM peptidoglycan-binding domain-containing protein [unclassified Thioalkalivibrio]|uniref:LysM peptidoglycan-binding domain-containing protein n=1 Tax=unclassified Thioalkalivibrio TaxID=2621013 RepID=UPI00036621DE|nr:MULTISPECIES: LysM peptidoglycan-binding domain-containing protein [unclassified Thioalkalivibrio]